MNINEVKKLKTAVEEKIRTGHHKALASEATTTTALGSSRASARANCIARNSKNTD